MLDTLALKQSVLGYLPKRKLVKIPYQDFLYLDLYSKSIDVMSKSSLASNLTDSEIDWINHLALYTSVTIKKSRPNWIHGYLIYDLVKKHAENSKKPEICYFETGTARGFTALVATKAIIDAGKRPKVITLDRLNDNKRRHWNAIGDINGKRYLNELLSSYTDILHYIRFVKIRSERIKKFNFFECVDIVFLDSQHTYKAVKREFNFIHGLLDLDSIVIFDDVDEKYPGIHKFINELNGDKRIINSEFDSRKYVIYCASI
jgi:hypothetical protein